MRSAHASQALRLRSPCSATKAHVGLDLGVIAYVIIALLCGKHRPREFGQDFGQRRPTSAKVRPSSAKFQKGSKSIPKGYTRAHAHQRTSQPGASEVSVADSALHTAPPGHWLLAACIADAGRATIAGARLAGRARRPRAALGRWQRAVHAETAGSAATPEEVDID